MGRHIQSAKWQTLSFFALAYVWSWAWWLPVVYTMRSDVGFAFGTGNMPAWMLPAILMGAYGPTLAAVVMTAYASGVSGVKVLLSQFLRWRASVLVHMIVWLGLPACFGIAMLLAPESTALLGDPQWERLKLIPMVLLSVVAFGPLAEELGWRGYALPQLQQKYSALVSSLLIGVAWCFWHTPLFWAPSGTLISGQTVTLVAVAKYLLFTCGLSIVFTWIFNNSRGSVLLAVVFHAIGNATLPLLLFPQANQNASQTIMWLSMIPLWAFALVLIAIYGGARLSKTPPILNEQDAP